jgi:peptidase M28-like protein
MKSRALSLLILAVVVPASAQMRVSLDVASAPSARLGALPVLPGLAGSFGAIPLLAPSSLTPALAARPAAPSAILMAAAPAAIAPAPLIAAPALAAHPATASAQIPSTAKPTAELLAAKLAAVPAEAATALTASFDGRMISPSVPVEAVPSAPLSPEQFALEGRRRFEEVRRAEKPSGVQPEAVATDDEMRGRLEQLPGTNPEREKYVIDLFKLAGAKPEDIILQDIGHGKHNIMVVKKGKTDRVIVVGGHHDKVEAGMGAIDNGTGSTMVANLYQALHDQQTDATIVFVAFGREEEGLLGSEAYLRSLTEEQKLKIDAMVNLDTLGVNGTFSWKNNSTRALLDRAKSVAASTHRDLVEAHLDGGDADSSSFRSAGIPAITIYGASEDVIFDIIHTDRDTMAAFDLAHYKNSYLLVLDLVKSLDEKKLGTVPPGKV